MGNTGSKPNKNKSDKSQNSDQQTLHSAFSLASSEHVVEKPHGPDLGIWHDGLKVLENIILDYSFEAKIFEHPVTKFWTPSLKQEILSLAYHAAPFDQVEYYVKKAHARKEKHLKDTLVEATLDAIKNRDITLKEEDGNTLKNLEGHVIAEGMAEKLIDLHDALYPDEMKCIDKVKLKLPPVEDEKEKHAREKMNIAIVNQIFDSIKLNDQKTNFAIQHFKEYVAATSPLNRIHLLFVAFDVLSKRGGELPKIEGEPYGHWSGKLADRFCFEVIGAGIQKNLPPRMQQLLKSGLYFILNRDRIAQRSLDVDGLIFRGLGGAVFELGADTYYSLTALESGSLWRRVPPPPVSQNLLRSFTAALTTSCDDQSFTLS